MAPHALLSAYLIELERGQFPQRHGVFELFRSGGMAIIYIGGRISCRYYCLYIGYLLLETSHFSLGLLYLFAGFSHKFLMLALFGI